MQLDEPPTFVGAVTSVLPLDAAAHHEHLTDVPIVGSKRRRCDGHEVTQPLDAEKPSTSAGNATHTVLFPQNEGDRLDTENACTSKHYVRKMLGSVADVFGKAEDGSGRGGAEDGSGRGRDWHPAAPLHLSLRA